MHFLSCGKTKIAEAMAADGARIQWVLGGILDAKYRMRPVAAHPSSAKKFGGAMAQESKTFMGMLGNLTEQWARFRNLVMASGLFDWLTGRLGRLLDTLDRMAASGELQQWAKRVGDGLITAFQHAGEIGRQLWPVVTGIAGAVGAARDGGRRVVGVAPDGDGMSSGERPALMGRTILEVIEAVRQLSDEGPQEKEQYQQPEAPVEAGHKAGEDKEQAPGDASDGVLEKGIHAGILAWRT